MSVLSLTQEFPPHLNRSDALLELILGVWEIFAVAVASAGVVTRGPISLWLFPLLIFGPVTLFALGLLLLPALRTWALGLDRRFLMGIHAMRTVGLSFVFLYMFDILPAAFAFPAGLGDAIVAGWAVWISFGLARGASVDDATITRWDWFGIADFLIAVGIGLASRSTFLGAEVNTNAMGALPLALIPLYAVPILAISHLIIALQLREARRPVTAPR